MVYKLVRLDGRDVLKLSPGKATWVGAKQIIRRVGPDGRLTGDVLALEEETGAGRARRGLLEPVMRGGPAAAAASVAGGAAGALRGRVGGAAGWAQAAAGGAMTYPVAPSEALRAAGGGEGGGGRQGGGQSDVGRRSDGQAVGRGA